MRNGSDTLSRIVRVRPPARGRRWLNHWLEAIDGDFAFRMIVVTAGAVSTMAFAFGLLSP
ncbi:hypothetical protein ACE10Z_22045 [Bradyrhizobium sp. Pha-3]|uniref:hypothetical protein n=1 Tax=Bradyrhizobium sp. Pha-3 TaxID=208375 RepID=UPI0035D4DE16